MRSMSYLRKVQSFFLLLLKRRKNSSSYESDVQVDMYEQYAYSTPCYNDNRSRVVLRSDVNFLSTLIITIQYIDDIYILFLIENYSKRGTHRNNIDINNYNYNNYNVNNNNNNIYNSNNDNDNNNINYADFRAVNFGLLTVSARAGTENVHGSVPAI